MALITPHPHVIKPNSIGRCFRCQVTRICVIDDGAGAANVLPILWPNVRAISPNLQNELVDHIKSHRMIFIFVNTLSKIAEL
jgi:hypothetical protein